jgi:hypothetical protein
LSLVDSEHDTRHRPAVNPAGEFSAAVDDGHPVGTQNLANGPPS